MGRRVLGVLGGVGSGVDGLKLEDADVGVDGGGFGAGVAEQLLDEADVGSAFEHVGGAGVAEEMGAAFVTADVGAADISGDEPTENVGVEAFAVGGEEEVGFGGGDL